MFNKNLIKKMYERSHPFTSANILWVIRPKKIKPIFFINKLSRYSFIFLSMMMCFPAEAQIGGASDPAFEASKMAFENLPETERQKIQEDLIWSGDYNGMAGGVFGPMTYRAITNFQKKQSIKPDGILNGAIRSALASVAKNERSSVRFSLIDDKYAHITIGLPQKIFVKESMNKMGGSRWQSKDDKITLDTRMLNTEDTEFEDFYENQLTSSNPDMKITYKYYRDNLFVVTGETATGKFYKRYVTDTKQIKGFSVGYEKSLASTFDKIIIAIANSFNPNFDNADSKKNSPLQATSSQTSTLSQDSDSDFKGFNATTSSQGASKETASHQPRSATQGEENNTSPHMTGFLVAPNTILSLAANPQCPSPSINGKKLNAIQKSGLFALYKFETQQTPEKFSLSTHTDGPVYILSATQNKRILLSNGAFNSASSVLAALPIDASGAPILSSDGALVGIVGSLPFSQVSINGIFPQAPYTMLPVAQFAETLEKVVQETRVSETEPTDKDVISTATIAQKVTVFPITCH